MFPVKVKSTQASVIRQRALFRFLQPQTLVPGSGKTPFRRNVWSCSVARLEVWLPWWRRWRWHLCVPRQHKCSEFFFLLCHKHVKKLYKPVGLPDFLFSQSCKDTWLIPSPPSGLWLESCSVHHIQLHTHKCCGTLSYPSLIYPTELTTFCTLLQFLIYVVHWFSHKMWAPRWWEFLSIFFTPVSSMIKTVHGSRGVLSTHLGNEWMSGHLSERVYLWMSHCVCDTRLCLSVYECVEVCICGCMSMSTSAFVCVHLWLMGPGVRTCVSMGTSVCVSMCPSSWSGWGEGLWCCMCVLHPTVYPNIWMRNKKTWHLWAPSPLPLSQPVPNRWQISPTVGHTVTFRGSSQPPMGGEGQTIGGWQPS